MPLRIAQLAPPLETVPPTGYGGTERVIATLIDELMRRGHEVTLFAAGDSQTHAELVPIVDRALWHLDEPSNDLAAYMPAIHDIVASQLNRFDVVHSHLDLHGFPLADRGDGPPIVTTLHGRLDTPELWRAYDAHRHLPLVSISDAQRQPLRVANWRGTVHHGINLDEFNPNLERGTYLAFLGRIAPEKGVDMAIRVARRAGLPLKIAARLPLEFGDEVEIQRDRDYYKTCVEPLLNEPGVELLGEVNGAAKYDLLRDAAALLFPIRWPEPFGLVMVEALASGTPVVALNQGSVPEIVVNGVTGFIGECEDDLVTAVAQLSDVDRGSCRAEAERRFSPARMADRYEFVYNNLLGRTRRLLGD